MDDEQDWDRLIIRDDDEYTLYGAYPPGRPEQFRLQFTYGSGETGVGELPSIYIWTFSAPTPWCSYSEAVEFYWNSVEPLIEEGELGEAVAELPVPNTLKEADSSELTEALTEGFYSAFFERDDSGSHLQERMDELQENPGEYGLPDTIDGALSDHQDHHHWLISAQYARLRSRLLNLIGSDLAGLDTAINRADELAEEYADRAFEDILSHLKTVLEEHEADPYPDSLFESSEADG